MGDAATYDTIYMSRFRIRSASPLFGRARWISPAGNAPLEADLRTMPEPASLRTRRGGVLLWRRWRAGARSERVSARR